MFEWPSVDSVKELGEYAVQQSGDSFMGWFPHADQHIQKSLTSAQALQGDIITVASHWLWHLMGNTLSQGDDPMTEVVNQAAIDGNKRSAVANALTFLNQNGVDTGNISLQGLAAVVQQAFKEDEATGPATIDNFLRQQLGNKFSSWNAKTAAELDELAMWGQKFQIGDRVISGGKNWIGTVIKAEPSEFAGVNYLVKWDNGDPDELVTEGGLYPYEGEYEPSGTYGKTAADEYMGGGQFKQIIAPSHDYDGTFIGEILGDDEGYDYWSLPVLYSPDGRFLVGGPHDEHEDMLFGRADEHEWLQYRVPIFLQNGVLEVGGPQGSSWENNQVIDRGVSERIMARAVANLLEEQPILNSLPVQKTAASQFDIEDNFPQLIWRAPEENFGHEYDPGWDYELTEPIDPAVAQEVANAAQALYDRTKMPFEVFAVSLGDDTVAKFCSGTGSYPTILIDVAAHAGYEDQYYQSMAHELQHGQQEQEGLDFNEAEAENWHLGASQFDIRQETHFTGPATMDIEGLNAAMNEAKEALGVDPIIYNAYDVDEGHIGSVVFFVLDQPQQATLETPDPCIWVEWIWTHEDYQNTRLFLELALKVKQYADAKGLPIKAYYTNEKLEQTVNRYMQRAASAGIWTLAAKHPWVRALQRQWEQSYDPNKPVPFYDATPPNHPAHLPTEWMQKYPNASLKAQQLKGAPIPYKRKAIVEALVKDSPGLTADKLGGLADFFVKYNFSFVELDRLDWGQPEIPGQEQLDVSTPELPPEEPEWEQLTLGKTAMSPLPEEWVPELRKEVLTKAQEMGLTVHWMVPGFMDDPDTVRWNAQAEYRKIKIPWFDDDIGYLVAMHELGHHALGHMEWGSPWPDEHQEVEDEAATWRWAIDNSAIQVTQEMVDAAKREWEGYRQHAIEMTRGYEDQYTTGPNTEWFEQYQAKTAMGLHGDLPENMTIERDLWSFRPTWRATVDGKTVGYLAVNDHKPTEPIVANVEIEPEYQRRGVATALIEYAEKELGRPIKHAWDEQSSEGTDWASQHRPDEYQTWLEETGQLQPGDRWDKTSMGLHGDLPEGLSFTMDRQSDFIGLNSDVVDAWIPNYLDENKPIQIGTLHVDQSDGKVNHVEVDPDYRRMGIADAMFNYFYEQTGKMPEHDWENQSLEGREWAQQHDPEGMKQYEQELGIQFEELGGRWPGYTPESQAYEMSEGYRNSKTAAYVEGVRYETERLDGGRSLVHAYLGDERVGYLGVYDMGDYINVSGAWVKEEYQNSQIFLGLGQKLIQDFPGKPISALTYWPGIGRILDRYNQQFGGDWQQWSDVVDPSIQEGRKKPTDRWDSWQPPAMQIGEPQPAGRLAQRYAHRKTAEVAMPEIGQIQDFDFENVTVLDKGWRSYIWGPANDEFIQMYPEVTETLFRMMFKKENVTWKAAQQALIDHLDSVALSDAVAKIKNAAPDHPLSIDLMGGGGRIFAVIEKMPGDYRNSKTAEALPQMNKYQYMAFYYGPDGVYFGDTFGPGECAAKHGDLTYQLAQRGRDLDVPHQGNVIATYDPNLKLAEWSANTAVHDTFPQELLPEVEKYVRAFYPDYDVFMYDSRNEGHYGKTAGTTLYHVTPTENMESVMRDGLFAAPNYIPDDYNENDDTTENRLYLFQTPDDAKRFAEWYRSGGGTRGVDVWQVNVPTDIPVFVDQRPYEYGDSREHSNEPDAGAHELRPLYIKNNIPPQNIRRQEAYLPTWNQWQPMTAEKSVGVLAKTAETVQIAPPRTDLTNLTIPSEWNEAEVGWHSFVQIPPFITDDMGDDPNDPELYSPQGLSHEDAKAWMLNWLRDMRPHPAGEEIYGAWMRAEAAFQALAQDTPLSYKVSIRDDLFDHSQSQSWNLESRPDSDFELVFILKKMDEGYRNSKTVKPEDMGR